MKAENAEMAALGYGWRRVGASSWRNGVNNIKASACPSWHIMKTDTCGETALLIEKKM